MSGIGMLELLAIFVIALVVIGPEKLPSTVRTVGKTIGQVKRFFNTMQSQLDQQVRLEELNQKIMKQTEGQTFESENESESNIEDPAIAYHKEQEQLATEQLEKDKASKDD